MMPPSPLPQTRDLVLIGGGHTHALVLRMWAMAPLPGVRLTLISPEPQAAYSGMLPGHIAGHYPLEALQIDLVRLARHAGVRLILGRAEAIDRDAREVIVPGRAPVGYDLASINIGITSAMPEIPGFAQHAVAAKPLEALAQAWAAFVAAPGAGRVAVIGGGVAGVELALAAALRLGAGGRVTLIEAGPQVLGGLGGAARTRLLAHLERAGITVLTGAPVTQVKRDAVMLQDGREIGADFILGAAGARAQGWLADTGLALHEGFIAVDATLRSLTDPLIFAAGDIAHLSHAPRPKAGVFAVREAPVLLHNLKVTLRGNGRMRRYSPQKDYLKLISTGGKGAVADRFGLPLDGAWLWRWKDRIDRKFMAKFENFPAMPAAPLPHDLAAGVRDELAQGKPLCGGCGAKMGQADLKAALAGLPAHVRADVLSGPGDDAAILKHGRARQVLTTDHVRAFSEDPWLLAKITAIHALGDIWAMGAAPQAALAQVILPRLSPALQRRTLAEIMHAASAVFRDAGADLVGGHTSIGAELTLGFTVTGLHEGTPIGQAGARPGDALILTKPLGTGVILAAEMAGAAPGAAVAGAFASMCRPLGIASALLGPVAGAMTDVTGFGLAGHLLGILEASNVAATLSLKAIPMLGGAEALAAAGHGSTLLPANRAAEARMFYTPSPRAELLFDPQTAGGLLAAVPAANAKALIKALNEAGETAAIIGEITAGAPFLTVEA